MPVVYLYVQFFLFQKLVTQGCVSSVSTLDFIAFSGWPFIVMDIGFCSSSSNKLTFLRSLAWSKAALTALSSRRRWGARPTLFPSSGKEKVRFCHLECPVFCICLFAIHCFISKFLCLYWKLELFQSAEVR